MSTITVRATGHIKAKADYVQLTISLEALNKDYGKMMNQASKQFEDLQKALVEQGFKKGDLKTTDYNIQTRYENVSQDDRSYKQVFVGYCCRQQLLLSFDFTNETLSSSLTALNNSDSKPEINVRFTSKDVETLKDELLVDATRNGKKVAQLLAKESQVKLGKLININYGFAEKNFYSNTTYDDCEATPRMMTMNSVNITPEDIDVKDNVTFEWEILD